jgi:MFS family permease
MPIAAVLVSIIPLHWSLLSLMVSIIALNLVMAAFRSPTVAMMPDLTPEPLRSKANGIINLMGGLGGIIAFFVGSMLYLQNPAYPFYMASALILVSLIVLVLNIKEKRDSINYNEIPVKEEKLEGGTERHEKTKITRNVILLLLAIFFWFVAYNAVETFFTTYGVKYLNINEAVAASKFTFFSVSMVVFAIPAGFIATKIGRKKTIAIGLVLMIALFGILFFAHDINTIGYLFIGAGASWALININSYPFVVSMTNGANIGRYTGYYYLFSSLAAIVSPPLIGLLFDMIGYGILFEYSVIGFVLALVFILLIKPPKEKIESEKPSIESFDNVEI